MINIKKISIFVFIVFLLPLLSGCKNQEETREIEAIIASADSKTDVSQKPTLLSTQANEAFTPQATIDNSTPTPDLRISAEHWQQWPIIPEITNNAIVIYARGIQAKVGSKSFSRI